MSHSPPDDDTPADQALRRVLQSLPPRADAARVEALQARVLMQWRQHHAGAQPHRVGSPRGLLLRAGTRRGWVLLAGTVLGSALVLGLWLQRPDPVLEELLQPDVLSQMAIGEM